MTHPNERLVFIGSKTMYTNALHLVILKCYATLILSILTLKGEKKHRVAKLSIYYL